MLRNSFSKLLAFTATTLLFSCGTSFESNDYTAYFGGEIINPTSKYVLFCKDSDVLDTIFLKSDNTFFKTFDSLNPGLYSFKNEPEYQYVYFDKNDSIMVRVNTQEFDESVVFCGRGEEKNNFLMELYLKNEGDKTVMFDVYDHEVPQFILEINESHNERKKFYESQKQKIEWSEDFDFYAKASLDFYHYSKKEFYPLIHKIRTGKDISNQLPSNFYDFRKSINFNDSLLINYSPFVRYLTNMMNNAAFENNYQYAANVEKSLEINIKKLHIADSIFSNDKLKNIVLNNIAFTYLLEDQNLNNNNKFFEIYHTLSSDKSKHNEISKISNAIQFLKPGKKLPSLQFEDQKGNIKPIEELITKKTILFFWSKNLESHFYASHKKALELKEKFPEYNILSICLDDNHDKWIKMLGRINHTGINELRTTNFDLLKEHWVVNKIHRTLIVDKDCTIINAFVSLYDQNFSENLK